MNMNDQQDMTLYAKQTNIGVYIEYVHGNVNNYNYGLPKVASQHKTTAYDEVVSSEKSCEPDDTYICPTPEQLRNDIFKTAFNEGELDLVKLWLWIDANFLKRLANQYDWMALWRVLTDKHLIRNSRQTTKAFVTQMEAWFVEPPQKCNAGSINLYRSGYLGETPNCDWNEETFERRMKNKQRMEGFRRLNDLCHDLMKELDMKKLTK